MNGKKKIKERYMKKLLLIDGNALIHRAYHALPPLKTKKGELVNAIYGFLAVLFKVLKEVAPDFVAATFDLAGPTFRHNEFQDYKAKRIKAPQELYDQIPKIKEILSAAAIPIFEKQGFEADDVLGTIVSKISRLNPDIENIIVSGDLDTLQLINDNTKVYTLKKGIRDTIVYDRQAVLERYGLSPEQIVDFKGLKGDPSDNIPGVPGIGEKTAQELLRDFGTIEKMYEDLENKKAKLSPRALKLKDKLLEHKQEAFFSKYLATIKKDVEIDFDLSRCELRPISNNPRLIKILEDLEFYSLIKRIQ